jgi:hypothetical protein
LSGNNGIRIVIDRRAGGRWRYRLNVQGQEYYGRTVGEATLTKAAEDAERCLSQIEISRQIRRTA